MEIDARFSIYEKIIALHCGNDNNLCYIIIAVLTAVWCKTVDDPLFVDCGDLLLGTQLVTVVAHITANTLENYDWSEMHKAMYYYSRRCVTNTQFSQLETKNVFLFW